jgi:hypothetical protein
VEQAQGTQRLKGVTVTVQAQPANLTCTLEVSPDGGEGVL